MTRRRKRSASNSHNSRPLLGAVVGIALGMLPLVVVIEVADGMIDGILRRFMETSSYNFEFAFYRDPSMEEYDKRKSLIKDISSVRYVTIERTGPALGSFGDAKAPLQIRGVETDIYEKDTLFQSYLTFSSGRFDLTGKKSILLGEASARSLGANTGDAIILLTGMLLPNGKLASRAEEFIVKGIFSSGYEEMDRLWAFVSLKDSERLIHDSTGQIFIGIKVDDPIGGFVKMEKKFRNAIPSDGILSSWKDKSYFLRQNFDFSRAMLLLIMALIVLVAATNVSSSMIMVVLERNREIAIQKTMGVSPTEITIIYQIIGIIYGGIGIVCGTLLGVIISLNINGIIYGLNTMTNVIGRLLGVIPGGETFEVFNARFYLERIPVEVRYAELLGAMGFALFLVAVSTFLPALRAGRLRPVEIIRND